MVGRLVWNKDFQMALKIRSLLTNWRNLNFYADTGKGNPSFKCRGKENGCKCDAIKVS